MTNEELLTLMQHTDPDREFLKELQDKLRAELDMPIEEQNIDLIAEIGAAISAIRGTESAISVRAAAGIDRFKREIAKTAHTHRRIHIRYLIAVACAVVLLVSNVFSYSVWGMNSFSAVYRILNGGITINMTMNSDIKSKNDYDYASEMRDLCEQHGFCPLTPSYIPNCMSPTDIYGTGDENESFCVLFFNFRSRNSTLNFQFTAYSDSFEIPPLGIPTDTYHVTETEMNGVTVYIIEEDELFTAAFLIDRIQYLIAAKDLDYDECQRVLTSMFA